MQMLDGNENQQSGREIFGALKKNAEGITQAFKEDKVNTGAFTDLLIHYDSVAAMPGKICKECCEAEQKAKTMPKDVDLAKGQSVDAKTTGKPYPLKAGASEATMIVTGETDKAVQLAGSSIPENRSASTLISGFVLKEWNHPKKGGGRSKPGSTQRQRASRKA